MGYFQVRYDSRVVNYDRRGYIILATGPIQHFLCVIMLCAFKALRYSKRSIGVLKNEHSNFTKVVIYDRSKSLHKIVHCGQLRL